MDMDAEAAIKLEQAATRRIEVARLAAGHGRRLAHSMDGVLDLRPLLGELAGQRDAEQGAALFHATLVAALAEWTARACATAGIETVALGGGCFFNRLLAAGLRRELEALGLRVLAPIKLVPGDAGLALGQAWVALHTLEN
jgi:hydrogenase maturation protein HypF